MRATRKQKDRERWITPGNIIAAVSLVVAIALAIIAGWQARRLAEDTGQFAKAIGNIHIFGQEIVEPALDIVFELPPDSGALSVAQLPLAVSNSGDRTLRNTYLVITTSRSFDLLLPDSLLQATIEGPTRGRRISREVQQSEAFTYVTHSLGDILPRTAVGINELLVLRPTRLVIPASDSLPLEIRADYAHVLRLTLTYEDAPPTDIRAEIAGAVPDSGQLEVEYVRRVYADFQQDISKLNIIKRTLARLRGPEPRAIIARPLWRKNESHRLYFASDSVRTSWVGWER